MREQINDQDMEEVVGGIVRVNGNRSRVGFTTLGIAFDYKCSYGEALGLAASMYEQYKNSSQAEYETAVMNAMKAKGWI